MSKLINVEDPTTAGVAPHVRIALAVVRQAIRDRDRPRFDTEPDEIEDARAFLEGGADLTFWADIIGIDAARLVRRLAGGYQGQAPVEISHKSPILLTNLDADDRRAGVE